MAPTRCPTGPPWAMRGEERGRSRLGLPETSVIVVLENMHDLRVAIGDPENESDGHGHGGE